MIPLMTKKPPVKTIEERIAALELTCSDLTKEITHSIKGISSLRSKLENATDRIDILEPEGFSSYLKEMKGYREESRVRLKGLITRLIVISEFAYFSQMMHPKDAGAHLRQILFLVDEPDSFWEKLSETPLGDIQAALPTGGKIIERIAG